MDGVTKVTISENIVSIGEGLSEGSGVAIAWWSVVVDVGFVNLHVWLHPSSLGSGNLGESLVGCVGKASSEGLNVGVLGEG